MLNMGKFALQLTHIMLLTDSNSNCNKSNHQHYLFISLWTTPAWYSILRCIFGMFNWHISKISQCYFVLDCIVLIGIISGIFSSCVPTIFDFFLKYPLTLLLSQPLQHFFEALMSLLLTRIIPSTDCISISCINYY